MGLLNSGLGALLLLGGEVVTETPSMWLNHIPQAFHGRWVSVNVDGKFDESSCEEEGWAASDIAIGPSAIVAPTKTLHVLRVRPIKDGSGYRVDLVSAAGERVLAGTEFWTLSEGGASLEMISAPQNGFEIERYHRCPIPKDDGSLSEFSWEG